MMKSSLDLPVDFSHAEHLVLEGSEAETVASLADTFVIERPRDARKAIETWQLRDRFHRRRLELQTFDDAMLTLTEFGRGKTLRAQRLDLRFLDPAAALTLRRPRRLLKLALGSAACGLLCLALDVVLPSSLLPLLGGASLALAALVALIAARRTGEEVVFFTRHGRAPALRWQAGFGCVRRSRKLRPRLAAAIDEASRGPVANRAASLRAEMREHYRLKEAGILSNEECTAAARRILAEFG
jgi:hypothetical protein